MPTNAVVRARIDEKIKHEASVVLEAMGLTISDALRVLLVRIAKDKIFPFEPLMPNKETIAAMKAARREKLTTVKQADQLLDSLNEDD